MTQHISPSTSQSKRDDTVFFGHPKGLGYLAFTEVWEGFSYYGMQALLTLYMVRHLLTDKVGREVIGLETLRMTLETLSGPSTTISFAAQIFGLYAGLINMTPLLGGWLGDRILGQTRAVTLGATLMTLGHLAMTSEQFFLFALALLVSGAGLIKGNMAIQIGKLYAEDDPRRTRAFGIYMFVRNLGAFSAPLICGTLGEIYGWHYGFGVAAIAMALALVIYLRGRKYLPSEISPKQRHHQKSKLTHSEWRSVIGLLLAFIPYILMFSAVFQAYNLLPIWVSDSVDRDVFDLTIPVTWLFTFDGIATMVGITITVRFWQWLEKRNKEPWNLTKMAVGCAMTCAAFLILSWGAASADETVSLLWVLLFFLFLDFSFIWGEPPLRSLVSQHAPTSHATTLMSLSIMSIAISNFVVGWLGRFYETMPTSQFWLLHAAIAGAGFCFAILLNPLIRSLLGRKPRTE
ncbi:peptide MFS transporter [Hyphococcus lacteus]|uniref:Peptide MFS transporter n=1 Tax=Hyphococcus lacteus TaxID=3143536 RepID=A0ABV3Z1P6_9PROT